MFQFEEPPEHRVQSTAKVNEEKSWISILIKQLLTYTIPLIRYIPYLYLGTKLLFLVLMLLELSLEASKQGINSETEYILSRNSTGVNFINQNYQNTISRLSRGGVE